MNIANATILIIKIDMEAINTTKNFYMRVFDGPIHTFSDTILLWSHGNGLLHFYTMRYTMLLKLSINIFSPLLDLKHFNFRFISVSIMA